ncbi:transcriptional repressor [Gulosibacter macacae]|uniref:Transcriptional repressor n=1 Tax=Gulosibacter macacae TaxID=2488791 RepID=A0A3P3W1J2_9MICO|nr:Fur family transcriptional regulator [Gulosibacter macacae]RRJ86743.1 transcriptional repressor [Gulosibacter macacae]
MTMLAEPVGVESAWPERLRAVGLRVTPRRVALLEALDAHPHALVDELHAAAAGAVDHLTKQSVYISLNDFVVHGLVRRIEPPGSAARYETRTADNHHHLVCEGCGAIADVDCAVGAAPCLTPADDAGFVVHTADVTYLGLCSKCQSAQRMAADNSTNPTTNPHPEN